MSKGGVVVPASLPLALPCIDSRQIALRRAILPVAGSRPAIGSAAASSGRAPSALPKAHREKATVLSATATACVSGQTVSVAVRGSSISYNLA